MFTQQADRQDGDLDGRHVVPIKEIRATRPGRSDRDPAADQIITWWRLEARPSAVIWNAAATVSITGATRQSIQLALHDFCVGDGRSL